MPLIHTFEASGLGKAPFQLTENPAAHGDNKDGIFWCEHCGTMLINRYFIVSRDNKVSVIGIDCLKKTGDQGLIDEQKMLARRAKEAKRVDDDEQRQAQRKQAFIEAYGISPEERETEIQARIEHLTMSFREAFSMSPAYQALSKADQFGNAMIDQANALKTFSPGMIRAIKEVTTKHVSGARKNSKAYKDACPAIDQAVDTLMTQLNESRDEIDELKTDIARKWIAL